MKWYFYLVPGLMAHLKKCAENERRKYESIKSVLTETQNKHDAILKELLRERACVDYYAELDNWRYCDAVNTYRASYINHNDYEWHEQFQRYVGGMMARETVRARK